MTIHTSILIGVLLVIQILLVYSSQIPSIHDHTDKSIFYNFNSSGGFSSERKNFHYDNRNGDNDRIVFDEDVPSKRLEINERANYGENNWKLLPFNKKKNLSTRNYNEVDYYNTPRTTYNESHVVFPDNNKQDITYDLVPSPCEIGVICENVSNYPHEIVERQLAKNEHLINFQNQDEMDKVPMINRIGGGGPTDDMLCDVMEQVLFPEVGLTQDGEYMYIANAGNYRQAIRIETCRKGNTPCKLIDGFASGYDTSCEQKYIYRRLLGVHRNGTLSVNSFKIPASCCCKVTFSGNTWERMGKKGQKILKNVTKVIEE